MCGIAGIYNRQAQAPDQKIIAQMIEALVHRGPDACGVFVKNNVALGHRRLAVIDLSPKAAQPMISQDGRYTITYNGEVYNFRELRKELIDKGLHFVSDSDTEVVLTAFAFWGENCLLKFNGMFAFAIYDSQEQSLFLARDRYGIKPLYYTEAAAGFIFASEVKALLKHPDITAKLNTQALYEYFTFQNIFTDKTWFRDIKMLPAGCSLRVSPDSDIKIQRYWDYCFDEPQTSLTENEYIEELKRLFAQAVKRQLVSDVEVGSYLSGGLDSASITAEAAGNITNLKTFTCGFDLSSASGLELNFDERQKAEALSYRFKTEHYEMVLKAGDMERCLKKLTWHLENPKVGQSYPNYYISRLASRFVKVVLSGTGGDEIFAGYPWRYYRAVINDDFEHYIDKYYLSWQRLVPNSDLKKLFSPIAAQTDGVWTRDIFRDVFVMRPKFFNRPEDYINHSLYFEAKTFLSGLLSVEDKLSMAHGLEARVPFLDNDLVDFVMKVPAKFKLGNLGEVIKINENEPGLKTAVYYDKTRDGKLLLRKAMSEKLSDEVVFRQKQGFSAPDASWFKGESIEFVKRCLLSPKARIYSFLDRHVVENLVAEHLEGKQNRRLFIWSLLSLENWCRIFLDKEAVS